MSMGNASSCQTEWSSQVQTPTNFDWTGADKVSASTLVRQGAVCCPFSLKDRKCTIWSLGHSSSAFTTGAQKKRQSADQKNSVLTHPWVDQMLVCPIGYRSTILYANGVFHMEVQESQSGVPLFVMQPVNSTERFVGTTPTSPWALLALRRGELGVLNGPHAFGFTHPLVARLLLESRTLLNAPLSAPSQIAPFSQNPKPRELSPQEAASGTLTHFTALDYDSQEDLPIRDWNDSKVGRNKEPENSLSEDKNNAFIQLIRAAELLSNEENLSGGTARGKETPQKESGKGKRKVRAETESSERNVKGLKPPRKKKRLADLTDRVPLGAKGSRDGARNLLKSHVAPAQGSHVAAPGFLKRRKEGKRDVKLSQRGAQMAQLLGSPKRARGSPVPKGGAKKLAERGGVGKGGSKEVLESAGGFDTRRSIS